MKVKRIVSPRAIGRFKFMTCAYFVIIAIQYLADFALAKVLIAGTKKLSL